MSVLYFILLLTCRRAATIGGEVDIDFVWLYQ